MVDGWTNPAPKGRQMIQQDKKPRAFTAEEKAKVQELTAVIRDRMPHTYAAIQAKALQIGSEAFGLVRRGLRGDPCCFWALEGGRVVGAPFDGTAVQAQVAQLMVQFGCAHVCMWGGSAAEPVTGGVDGAS